MKQKILAVSALCALLLTACGNTLPPTQPNGTSAPEPETTAAETVTEDAAETTQPESSAADESSLAVASGDDVIEANAVGYEGMEPIPADAVLAGEYYIQVDSSSSMFKIASCKLIVADGEMNAELTINSKSYEYLFAGTAEEAAKADPSAFIAPEETENGCKFTFPVEALDQEIPCAAFSHKKQLWYDRKLVFRADSLADSSIPGRKKHTVETLGLADGAYTIEVMLQGGSGKASVQSPAKLTVSGGKATAEIIWSSNKYDYMRIGDEKYLPTDTTEFSVFEIPVDVFDRKIKVLADTTAMSTPHEIEYTLYFDSLFIK